jgi:hypothetical protein
MSLPSLKVSPTTVGIVYLSYTCGYLSVTLDYSKKVIEEKMSCYNWWPFIGFKLMTVFILLMFVPSIM